MTKVLKRQGDILLERIGDIELYQLPNGWRRIEDGVIARGETSGHAHVLEGGVLTDGSRGQLVLSHGGAKVVHDEHESLELEPGVWLVRHQIEYGGDGQNVAVYD